MDAAVIITSAAVGAIVSSLVTALSQFFERRVRRDELLIKASPELTIKYMEFMRDTALKIGKSALVPPHIFIVYDSHRQLKYLMKHGKLPEDAQKKAEEYFKLVNSVERA